MMPDSRCRMRSDTWKIFCGSFASEHDRFLGGGRSRSQNCVGDHLSVIGEVIAREFL